MSEQQGDYITESAEALQMLGKGYEKRGDYIESTAVHYMAEYDSVFTVEFIRTVKDLLLSGVPGVYYFSANEDASPVYIGQSVNLGARIIQSYSERFCLSKRNFWDRKSRAWTNNLYVQYIIPERKSDLLILESYLIAKLKPLRNKTGKFEDETSIHIDVPEFSERIRIVDGFTEEYIKNAAEKQKGNFYDLHIETMRRWMK